MDKANHACTYGSCQSSKEITYNLKCKSNYIAYIQEKHIEFEKSIFRQVNESEVLELHLFLISLM